MSEVDEPKGKKDQEERKVLETSEIKKAIWFHNQLIERFPDVYRILRRIYNEKK